MFALGVALVPHPHWIEKIIALNRRLNSATPGEAQSTLILGAHCLPHLTLFQCFLEDQGVDEFVARCREVLKGKALPTSIPVRGLSAGNPVSTGETTPWVECSAPKGSPCAKWNELFHEASEGLRKENVDPKEAREAFADPEVMPDCVSFVRDYWKNASRDRFSPHVTIGFGSFETIRPSQEPFQDATLEFSSLLIGQLGNYCTVGRNVALSKDVR